jgi:hypothetical protein
MYFIYPQIMNWTVLAGLAAAEPNCTQKKWVHEQAQKNEKKSSIRPNPMQKPLSKRLAMIGVSSPHCRSSLA